MSTRAFIAVLSEDGQFTEGRYTHSDGYPTHMGKALLTLIRRDGADTAIRTLTQDHHAWSIINPDTPSIMGVEPDPHADYGTAAKQADLMAGPYPYFPGNNVAGYGVGTEDSDVVAVSGGLNYDSGLGWCDWTRCEWAYLIDPFDKSMRIVAVDQTILTEHGILSFDEDPSPEVLALVECGTADLSQCSHHAWFHFDVPDQSSELSTAEWLGKTPIAVEKALTVTIDGRAYTMMKSGLASYIRRADDCTPVIGGDDQGWLQRARSDSGAEVFVRIRDGEGNPVAHDYTFPEIARSERF